MLKTTPLKPKDLGQFVACYFGANPADAVSAAYLGPDIGLKPDLQSRSSHDRAPTYSASTPDIHWRVYGYDDSIARDKASPDICWLKDESQADSDHVPPPAVIAQAIVGDLEAAREQFRGAAGALGATDAAL